MSRGKYFRVVDFGIFLKCLLRVYGAFLFAKHFSLIDNSSSIPPLFLKATEETLLDIHVSSNNIRNTIRNLDLNKGYAHDMINILMFNLSLQSVPGQRYFPMIM